MTGGLAPRLALEAGFLILLGVGAGLAGLRTAAIVALLAGGWVLVSLIELTVWRSQAGRAAGPTAPLPPPDEMPDERYDDEDEGEEDAYPLRADAGETPSAEVEAYTRVLDTHEGVPPEDRAE